MCFERSYNIQASPALLKISVPIDGIVETVSTDLHQGSLSIVNVVDHRFS